MRRTHLKYGLLIILLALVLVGCGGGGGETVNTVNNSPSDNPVAQNNTPEIVARVNDEPISRDEFERELARRKQFTQVSNEQALENAVLDTLIEQELILQAAAGLNVAVTDEEVQAEIYALIAQAGNEETWRQWLAQNLYSEAEIFDATRLQILTQRVREQVITMGNTPANGTVLKVHARHILVSSESQAQDVLTRLQNAEDFAQLAALYSRDVTTKDAGGDLGFFVREDLTTPELADAAFSMQPGEIAGPIGTALGYHVIQTLEFEDQPVTEITQGLQAEARFSTWLETQRRAARVERLIQ
jgi:foldase protein PrsA